VAYAEGDTTFNESYATTVERLGVARWLTRHGSAEARHQYAQLDARREDFRALTTRYRDRLQALFSSTASAADKRAGKAALMTELRADYARMKSERWGGFAGYDGWFERANNASFGVLAAYNEQVPEFERLFERQGRDFARFHAEVKRLASLPKAERHATLRAL
jgi:predicted aminopeptidase